MLQPQRLQCVGCEIAPAWPTAPMAVKNPLPSSNVIVSKQRFEIKETRIAQRFVLHIGQRYRLLSAASMARAKDFSVPLPK
jgi:hypothetical protein